MPERADTEPVSQISPDLHSEILARSDKCDILRSWIRRSLVASSRPNFFDRIGGS